MAIALRNTSGPTGSVGTALTLTKPSGTVTGDVMIATIKCNLDGAITAPGAWSLVQQQADTNNGTTSVYWVDGAETSLGFTMPVGTPTNGAVGTVVTYSGCDTIAPIGVSGKSSTAGAASPFTWTAPTITTTRDLAWRVVGFGYVDFNDAAAPAFTQTGTSQRVNGTVADAATPAKVGISVGDVIKTPPGATGTTSCTATGGDPSGGTQQAVVLELQPPILAPQELEYDVRLLLHPLPQISITSLASLLLLAAGRTEDYTLFIPPPAPSDEGGGVIYFPARARLSIRIG